jgi:SAM-dependent methyltransferase
MIRVDPPSEALPFALAGSGASGQIYEFISCGSQICSFPHNQDLAVDNNSSKQCRAVGPDPSIFFPAALAACEMRYLFVAMSCRTRANAPHAQLFWAGERRPGYSERLSIRIPLVADGREHTYLVDLHETDGIGSINHNWWHNGTIQNLRFDPLDCIGEFRISRALICHQDLLASADVRTKLQWQSVRNEVSYRYLYGSGVEMGALQNPLPVPPLSYIQYADRLSLEQARAQYPELADAPLVSPSILCDAAHLDPIQDGSLDFLIANHVLEHLRDPLSAVIEWLRVLRSGGYLYLAIPEHTNPLDRHREVTSVEHLLADFEARGTRSHDDRQHFSEWAASPRFGYSAEQQALMVEDLIQRGYAIHFHAFSSDTFLQLLGESQRRSPSHLVECRVVPDPDVTEFIAVLRRC